MTGRHPSDDLMRRFPQLAASDDGAVGPNADASPDDAADQRDKRRIEAFRGVLDTLRRELDDIR
ncbi:hypothetical protein [Bifidobacterium leontopitheci]|uniref:Uncharacterized protein n=1 Tax=Bifidobacterium leontopitheci TaxID=2650774 RepID=A0A6I1GNH8_9BIFI|nr:hypothetical protein [Bifidobacterium leontopitheci]KAB7790949.1 hypothetical protein F7D09_0495 [Bifidobacterium leontopitheci]